MVPPRLAWRANRAKRGWEGWAGGEGGEGDEAPWDGMVVGMLGRREIQSSGKVEGRWIAVPAP